jgi:hypothetical protein
MLDINRIIKETLCEHFYELHAIKDLFGESCVNKELRMKCMRCGKRKIEQVADLRHIARLIDVDLAK